MTDKSDGAENGIVSDQREVQYCDESQTVASRTNFTVRNLGIVTMADIAFIIGGVVPLGIVSLLVRSLFFRRRSAGLKKSLLAVLFAWPLVTIIASFGMGKDGFVGRLQNIPDVQVAIGYGCAALILVFILLVAAGIKIALFNKSKR